jgi:hypothetical protein
MDCNQTIGRAVFATRRHVSGQDRGWEVARVLGAQPAPQADSSDEGPQKGAPSTVASCVFRASISAASRAGQGDPDDVAAKVRARPDEGGRAHRRRLPAAHSPAVRRLPLRPSADDPVPDPIVIRGYFDSGIRVSRVSEESGERFPETKPQPFSFHAR